MARKLGEVRKQILEAGGAMDLGNGIEVKHEKKGDIDFYVKEDGLVGLMCWLSKEADEEDAVVPFGQWVDEKETPERRKVVEAFLNGEEAKPEPEEKGGGVFDILEGQKEKIEALQLEVDEADQRAEDAERAQERATGRAEGLKEALEVFIGGREVSIGK